MIDSTEPVEQPLEQPAARRSPLRVIARNTLFGMGAQFSLRGLGFLFNIFVVNRLGDVGYGQYSTVLAWTNIFAFLGDMGIAMFMAREIARDREKSLSLFWDVAALRLLLAVLAGAVTVIGALLMGYGRELIVAIGLISSTYLIQAITAPLGAILGGYERLDVISALTVLGQLFYYVTATLLLLAFKPGFLSLVIASVAYLPLILVICLAYVLRNGMRPPPIQLHPHGWLDLLRAGFPFALIQVSLTFAFRFDTLLLGQYFSDEIVGWYNAAYTLTRNLLIFTSAFSAALVPTMAREYALDQHSIRPWYFRSVKYISMIGLPLAMGGTLLADVIIVKLYGLDFTPSILAFAILIWDTPILMYTSICGNFSTAMKIESRSSRVYLSMALFNIALNLLLIPRYGMLGASVVTVATEFAGALLFYRIFRRQLGAGLGLTSMLRLALALAVMGTAVYGLRFLHPLVLIPLGALVYLAAVLVLRVLTPEEMTLAQSILRRGMARLARRAS